jgi:hypothetical protein
VCVTVWCACRGYDDDVEHPMKPIGDYGFKDDDVRSRPHNGLKSDIAPCPKSAKTGIVPCGKL